MRTDCAGFWYSATSTTYATPTLRNRYAAFTGIVRQFDDGRCKLSLSLAELTRIAEIVARTHTPELTIVGVTSTDVDSGRVELLVTVSGCHSEPCTLLLNLPRHERGRFEGELSTQLAIALQAHHGLNPQ